jgi:hypothetical protein
MLQAFGTLPVGTGPDADARRKIIEPLSTAATWEAAGLDPSLGAAAFSWPEKDRGALLVLPVRDRARFRAAFHLRALPGGGREVDELGQGYLCAPAAGRYLCARSLSEIDAAAAPHAPGLDRSIEKLPAEDRGDVELYASPRVREIARFRDKARPFGLLTGVSASVRFRADGATARVHVLGDTTTPQAKALAGAPPPRALWPAAAGAKTVVRVHLDPRSVLPDDTKMDPEVRAELFDELTGDAEIATSGDGLAGASIVAPLRDAARVERFVKKRCADAGGSMRRWLLDKIAVLDHGCAAEVNPALLLLPVRIDPVPLRAKVDGDRLVILVGAAHEPAPGDRAWDTLVDGDGARRALADAEALVAFTRSPTIGPDVGPASAFKAMIPFLNDRTVSLLDAWGEIAARVYQAVLTARVTEGGVVMEGAFTTFAADPPDARAAYEVALARRSRGDDAGYRAALADVERRFPGTLAARRAADVRTAGPYVGAGALFFAMLGGIANPKK